ITGLTPSGLAQVRVSASDLYGNEFSAAPVGMDLVIDTTPPTGFIETDPEAPVQVLSNTTLQVNLTLSEPPKSGTVPQVSFDPPAGATLNVAMSGSGTNWSGTVALSPLMGSGFCDFDLSVSDALDNTGSTLVAGESLEIYNTPLPTPPATPNLLDPVAVKGGYVHLVWYPVSNAETYRLYRMPGDAGVPATVVTDGIVSNGIVDLPPVDGNYRYAVSASRRGAESGLSSVYTEYSDRTPPGAPGNVAVQLQASGVQITWTAPTEGEAPIRYNVYRNGTKIGSSYVPTPINDYPPRGTSVYQVASADWLGNEALSASQEFVMLVPAVASFEVLMHESLPPALSWTKGDSSIVGVNLYRNGIKLNSTPLTGTAYEDTNYSGNSLVQYALKSVDSIGQEGPARVASVYRVGMELGINLAGSGVPILHYFDDYTATVRNLTLAQAFPLETVEFRRTYSGATATTVATTVTNSVPAGGTLAAGAAIASMAGSEAQNVRVRLLQTPDTSGAQVIYQRLFSFDDVRVANQMVDVTVTNMPVAGTLHNFKVRVFNRGFADMDVVLFKANGSQPGDVYVSIRNMLGGEISRGYFQGTVPGAVFAGGRGYVTVAPGGYVDLWVKDLLVPVSLAATGSMTVEAGVETLYHQIGTADQQVSGPISATEQLGLALTEYYGTSATDKSGYANDEQIVITGQALRRSDHAPLPDTPLRIGFAMGNHQWSEEVTTDGSGSYSFAYDVPAGVAGELTLWAAHPDMVDRLDQTVVTIHRMFVLPRFGDIRMSKNDTYTFSLNLLNPGSLPLSGLAATVRAYRMDGTNEVDITTVTATPQWTPGTAIGADALVSFPVELQAADDAPDNAVVEIRFSAAEGAADTFSGFLTLLEAVPIVDVVEPASGYVDVTVNRGQLATETVTVVNRGVRDFKGVKMAPASTHTWIAPSLVPAADGLYHLPDLPVGASNTFDVVYAPPAGIAMDRYSDVFKISGTNHPAVFNVPVYATVSSADKGDVQMFVQNTLSVPVPGATMRLRNRLLGTELAPVTTGTNGIVVVENLLEGLWYWQVSAPGHTTQAGSVEVVPDQMTELTTRLTKNVVTVNFTVVPVPFTDRYEIVIEQTFETHVPQPVMVVTPPWQRFDNIEPGFQVRFMATVKNHGLIALNDLEIEGQSFSWGSMVPLVEYLPRLDPFQEVQIPIVVNYYGEEGGGDQAQRQSAYSQCLRDMLGALANFSDNLNNLIDRFSGGYQCVNSIDPQTARTVIQALLAAHDEWGNAAPPGLYELAIIIGCGLADSSGSGSGGPGGGPSTGGGTAYGSGSPVCMAPDTSVLLADGQRLEASLLAVGDRVRSGSEEHEVAVVAEVVHGTGAHWITLGFEDDPEQPLTVTDEHLVWIDGTGWVAAKNVQVGDAVFTDGGLRIQVVSVEAFEEERPLVSVRLNGGNAMFAEGILVHDQCGWWTPTDVKALNGEVAP
uniref:hypothetical protein n=1 Tax=Pontiella sp. TaxID=2837462 RepID=UPI003566D639